MSVVGLLCLSALASSPRMSLVFSEEFDVPGRPDPKKWMFERGFVRNRELQWYQPQNAWVEDGCLIIEGRKEKVKNPDYDPKASSKAVGPASRPEEDWRKARPFASYSSASLKTKGLHSWTYGTFMIKARIRPEIGLWPAIWTVGDVGRWPSNGEIDIMEFYQQHLHANTNYGTGGGIWDSVRKPIGDFFAKEPDWASKFHIWRMDWDEQSIRLSMDGLLLNETDISKTLNPDGKNPFKAPHHIILNLALGSTGGDVSKTVFPSRFEVDYVRVWQKTG